ncbi:MAG: alkaline phosphatase family protein [Deltaproteobacteria bacterium]|nr:alkaline phosphatase family protein [Deltaproteobacteria bacterium]
MELPFPTRPYEAGLIVGAISAQGARVWIRAPGARPHELRVRGPACARALPVRCGPETDHTTVLDLLDLEPDTEHALDLVELSDDGGRSVLPPDLRARVRTLALHPDRLCFAFVSCHLPFVASGESIELAPSLATLDALVEVATARDARFVLHLGDQMYADPDRLPAVNAWRLARNAAGRGEPWDATALYRALYRGYFGVPSMRRLHARFGNLMMWDDGEIRDAWGSVPLPKEDGAIADAMFAGATRAYREWQHAHNPKTEGDDLHYAFDAGPASFFVLDLRSHRDAARRTLLGERQWRAFEQWIAATEGAPVRFVASSVPPLHTPDLLVERLTRQGTRSDVLPSAFHDRWSADAFHDELVRLLELLLPRGVVVLSGDIHIGAANEIVGRDDRRVHQWISSAITHQPSLVSRLESELVSRLADLASPLRVAARFHELANNFGLVELVRRGDRAWSVTFELWVVGPAGPRAIQRVEATAIDGIVGAGVA